MRIIRRYLIIFIITFSTVFISKSLYADAMLVNDSWVSWLTQWNGSGCSNALVGNGAPGSFYITQAGKCNSFQCEYANYSWTYDSGDASNLSYIDTAQSMNLEYCSTGYLTTRPLPVIDLRGLLAWGDNTRLPGIDYTNFLGGIIPISIENNISSTNWSGYFVHLKTARIYWVGCGDSFYDLRYEIPCEFLGTCPSPIPSQTPSPTSLPSSTPVLTPDPTPSPIPSQSPVVNPQPSFNFAVTPVKVGIDGEFTYDDVTGSGTITINLNYDKEMVDAPEYEPVDYSGNTGDIPLSETQGDESSDMTTVLDTYLDRADDLVDNVSGTWFKPVVDWMLDMLLNHPVIDAFRNVTFEGSGSVCSLSIELFGRTIEIGFCNLEDELAIFRYVVLGVAGVYSVLIVLKGD